MFRNFCVFASATMTFCSSKIYHCSKTYNVVETDGPTFEHDLAGEATQCRKPELQTTHSKNKQALV